MRHFCPSTPSVLVTSLRKADYGWRLLTLLGKRLALHYGRIDMEWAQPTSCIYVVAMVDELNGKSIEVPGRGGSVIEGAPELLPLGLCRRTYFVMRTLHNVVVSCHSLDRIVD